MNANDSVLEDSVLISVLHLSTPPVSAPKKLLETGSAIAFNLPDSNNNTMERPEVAPAEAGVPPPPQPPQSPKAVKVTKFLLEENCNNVDESGAKEVWTSFSRSFGRALESQPRSLGKFNSKLNDFLDVLKSMTDDNYEGFNLHGFIVAGILSNMKTLGVEEFECKEYVEHWLTQRRQRRWKSILDKPFCLFKRHLDDTQSFVPSGNFCDQKSSTDQLTTLNRDYGSETLTVFSPSKPNSSLMRLTGDGNVKLGQFLGKMDDVRSSVNNAICTVLQAIVVITLPYLKLTSSSHLETCCFSKFCTEWTEIVALLAKQVKSDTPDSTSLMLVREFGALRSESARLHKRVDNLLRKVSKILRDSVTQAEPAMKRLQPKNLPRFRGRRVAEQPQNPKTPTTPINTTTEQRPPPEPVSVIKLSAVPLDKLNLVPSDVFRNHLFFTKSKKGHLVFKYRMDDAWKRFSELSYQHKRELFLHTIDDLHATIKQGFSVSGHVKELFIDGYPESILVKIRESLKYLKQVSKENDLLVVSKVTITNQVKLFRDAMSRLIQTLQNAKDISKCLAKCIQSCVREVSTPSPFLWKVNIKKKTESVATTQFPVTKIEDWDTNLSLCFDDSKVRLLVPYFSPQQNNLEEMGAPSLM